MRRSKLYVDEFYIQFKQVDDLVSDDEEDDEEEMDQEDIDEEDENENDEEEDDAKSTDAIDDHDDKEFKKCIKENINIKKDKTLFY